MLLLVLLFQGICADVEKEVADVVNLVTTYPDAYGTVELTAGQLIIENKELEDVYLSMEEGVFLGETYYTKQGIFDKIAQNEGIIQLLKKKNQFVRVTAQGVMTFEDFN